MKEKITQSEITPSHFRYYTPTVIRVFFSFSNALSVFIDIYEFAELTPTRTFTVEENVISDFL